MGASIRDGAGERNGSVSAVPGDGGRRHPIGDAVARDLPRTVSTVAHGHGVASARRRAAVVTPDVVVMDMHLSDGTGAQATAEVLAVPRRRDLVLSASDERDDCSRR